MIPQDRRTSTLTEADRASTHRRTVGAEKGVLIATPTSLLALLHATHYGWTQAAVEESAQAIADAGRELHKRVATFVGHYAKVGKQLGAASEAFNNSVASFDGRVMPHLARLEQLGARSEKALEAPATIDHAIRPLKDEVAVIEAAGV